MPITIKQNTFKYRNPDTGDYDGVDVLAETTVDELIADIEEAAEDQIDAIEAKGEEVIESIPSDYSELADQVDDLKTSMSDINTATSSAIGKALSPKTVANGKVTEWQFKSIGGGTSADLFYVTPEEYGAVGDGVTDDSQAVQDACDAGYAVYFASGKTYYLASTVTIDHDCHLFGGEGATIKTITPVGGQTINAIIVQGALKATTSLTGNYTTVGTSDNSGNRITLSDMSTVSVGDILLIRATDQYYSYARDYYYLGATLLVTDVYDGHIYTNISIPWDITNTANVSVEVYAAPTAIFDNLNFISDLDGRGYYHYAISLRRTKNSIIRNCSTYEYDNGVFVSNCVNTLIDCMSMAKAMYDNSLRADSYGIGIYSSTNTIVQRVQSMCGQHVITTSGQTPVINTYIKECNLASECRSIAIGCHANTYNIVVEDCTVAGLGLMGTATVNRCHMVKGQRGDATPIAMTFTGSHNPNWATLHITDCVIDGTLQIQLNDAAVQSPVQAFDNIIGNVQIDNCVGGTLLWYPSANNPSILSNTINRLVLRNWKNCDYVGTYVAGAQIKYLEITDCDFLNGAWIQRDGKFNANDIWYLNRKSSRPTYNRVFVDLKKYGDKYVLPAGVPISFDSDDTNAHFVVCGENLASNNPSDFSLGSVSGSTGAALVRTVDNYFANVLSVNQSGNLVYTQPNGTSKAYCYPKCLTYVSEDSYAMMSVTLKNTGNTNGATFRPYIAIINCETGLLTYLGSGTSATATNDGVTITHERVVSKNSLVMFYLYNNTAVANSETTFVDFAAKLLPRGFDDELTYEAYTGTSRTGDGTLTSVDGINYVMATPESFDAKFKVDLGT